MGCSAVISWLGFLLSMGGAGATLVLFPRLSFPPACLSEAFGRGCWGGRLLSGSGRCYGCIGNQKVLEVDPTWLQATDAFGH